MRFRGLGIIWGPQLYWTITDHKKSLRLSLWLGNRRYGTRDKPISGRSSSANVEGYDANHSNRTLISHTQTCPLVWPQNSIQPWLITPAAVILPFPLLLCHLSPNGQLSLALSPLYPFSVGHLPGPLTQTIGPPINADPRIWLNTVRLADS